MPTIYLETSIVCHLTDPPSPNPITRACQQLTQLWWHTRCDPASTFISDYVHDEIRDSDPLRFLQRQRAIQQFTQHPSNEKMRNIRELLVGGGGLTANAVWAASHIACAAFHRCEVLLTWDCRNIANASQLRLLRLLTYEAGYLLPELVTPFELMENSHETLWSRNPN